MANGKTTIQRNPTFPLSKRDSVASVSSRMSLVSNGNAGSKTHCGAKQQTVAPAPSVAARDWKDSDFLNTNPNMVAGKKRTGKKVKRTDSYKKATGRQSGADDAVDVISNANVATGRTQDRKKYNTLPIKPNAVAENTETKTPIKRKDGLGGTRGKDPTDNFSRSESQKSKYYPSPDTDDDQFAVLPDRKKKSAFKRMKERLSQTFRRDRVSEKERRSTSFKVGKLNNSQDLLSSSSSSNGEFKRHISKPTRCAICGKMYSTAVQPGNGIFSSFRNSIRRKRSHKSRPVCTCTATQQPLPSKVQPRSNSGSGSGISQADPITETFNQLIDPATFPLGRARHLRPGLRLEGLHKFKPASDPDEDEADGPAPSRHRGDLSPDVEVDAPNFPEEDDIILDDQTRTRAEVGKRLTKIGDGIEAKRRETSSASENESQSTSAFDHTEILHALREFADTKDEELRKRAKEISVDIIPIIKCILAAKDFSGFQRAVRLELESFHGWDQVAWYTYLMKSALYLAGNSYRLKSHATRYFNMTLRPWIQSRPKGWESVIEETDVDSELD